MSNIQNPSTGYGLNQPLNVLAYVPILALRNPTNKDKAAYGSIWCNTAAGTTFILSSIGIGPNNYGWSEINGAEDFTSLTVSPGPISLTGTTTINITGNANTTIGSITGTGIASINGAPVNINSSILGADITYIGGGSGNVNINSFAAGDTNIGGGTGSVNITGVTNIGDSSSTATLIGIPLNLNATGAGDTNISGGTGAVNIGNSTGNTVIKGPTYINASASSAGVNIGNSATTMFISGSIGINVGTSNNITINSSGASGSVTIGNTTGNIALQGALSLLGPVQVLTGSGAPTSILAVNVGDLYINTTASTAPTRLYIATAAGSWTYFTSNA